MQQLPSFFRAPHLRLLIVASLAMNLLALALPMMTMQIYDRVMTNHAVDTLMVLSMGVLAAATCEFILRTCRNIMVGRVGAQFEHESSVRALERVMNTDPRNYENTPQAILMQDISSSSRLKDYYGGQIAATMLVDAPFAVLMFGMIVYLSMTLALVSFTILLVFGLLSRQQGRKLKRCMDAREEEDNKRYNFITQALSAVHTIKALCLEAVTARKFEEVQRGSGYINYRMSCIQGAASALGYTTSQLMTIAVICIGAPLVVSSHITVGILIACVMLSGQVMQPLQRGLSLWVRYQDIVIARDRLSDLLSLPERHPHTQEQMGANHGVVKITDLSFEYNNGEPILDGASLEIEAGEVVAINGASGAGKTTLLELIAGVYQPDKGRITLSGMEPSRIPPSERQRYISYLPARGLVLKGSIIENLSGFDLKNQHEVKTIVELLGIDKAVALLPAGYDTPLEGLATDVIAPGLKQRIAMARALLKKPRLIIYDNADQGLDRESYARVFSLLAKLKGKASILLVSEDKNILSIADRAVELRKGQLIPVMEPLHLLAQRKNIGV